MDNHNIPKIMMVAGEASGDLHCARLALKLRELCPSLDLFGMGGSLMSQSGVEVLYNISDFAVMGITEVIGRLPSILKRIKDLKLLIDNRKPDAIVLVDFPDFNIRLLPHAHSRHIPVIYYIPPKAWAWRKKRAKTLARYTTAIASIFPFEAEVYRKAGANVHYVGHPLLDFVKPSQSKDELYSRFSLDSSKPIVGLMPGSRKKEVVRLLPVILKSAQLIKLLIPDCQFVLPVAYTIPLDMIPEMTDPPVMIIDGSDVYNMMSITDLIIMASGTATLEATFMNAPMIVIYKVSYLTWIIMKSLVNSNIKSTTLPNIISNRNIVPELLQSEAAPEKISDVAVKILRDPQKLENQKIELKKIHEQMGKPGAVEGVAKLVLSYV